MAVTPTTFEGYLKYIEGALQDTLPNFAVLQRAFPFDTAKRVGRKFIYPVVLRGPQGFTYARTGTASKTAYTLNDPVTAETQEAELEGSEMTLQEDIAIGMLKAAQNPDASYAPIVPKTLQLMREACQFRLELELLYGRYSYGIGAVESVVDGGAGTCTVVISRATWAGGIWARMENAYIDVYDDDGDPIRNAATIQVTGVDPATRTLTLTGTEAELDTIVAGDIIVPRGWAGATYVAAGTSSNCFHGLAKTLGHTSGDLHSIDASSYSMWKGNRASAGSAKATLKKLLDVDGYAAARGATEDMESYLNNFVWNDIANDAMLLRQLGQESRREVELGTDKITFIANGRKLSLVPHPMVMSGHILSCTPSAFKRVGESDLVSLWDAQDMMHLESKNAVRFRNFSSQCLVPLEGPSRGHELYDVVPEGLA